MFVSSAFFVLFGLCQISGRNAQFAPLVETFDGKIQGQIAKSYNGRDYMEFIGIPYSEPRIGRKRFDAPEPVNKWHGIWIANLTTTCLQVNHWHDPEDGRTEGIEDCLHLNIFVPGTHINPDKPYDVIVHIHGGAWVFSSRQAYAGPKFIMDRDVILATFNYRVGIAGFLSTGDHHIPGNNGLKDQLLAMKWIKNNIAFFGGNPDAITLTGLSAGGAAAQYHYISPLSKGLFVRGMSVSGSAINAWALQEDPLSKARIIGKTVGCYEEDTGDLSECLKSRSGTQLNEAIRSLRHWLYNPHSPLAPVVDKWSKEPFMPEHPYSLLLQGLVNDVPWIFTIDSSEGLYPAAQFVLKPRYLHELDERFEEILPGLLHYEDTVKDDLKPEVAKIIRKTYFEDKPINNGTFHNLVQMISDRGFNADIDLATKVQANVSAHPVYFYLYDYLSVQRHSFALLFTGNPEKFGVCHGDDMMLVFSNPQVPKESELVPEDEKMKDFLLDVWTSYAKYGHPGIKGWNPVSKSLDEPLNYLYIGRKQELEMRVAGDIGNRAFWQNLPFEEHANLFKLN